MGQARTPTETSDLVAMLKAIRALISQSGSTAQLDRLIDFAEKLVAPQGVFSADITNGTTTAHAFVWVDPKDARNADAAGDVVQTLLRMR